MKIGKIPSRLLHSLILDPVRAGGVKHEDVLVRPQEGEDCGVIRFNDELCVVSTDPITGATNHIGSLAVHVSANDVACSGAVPKYMLLTVLLPEYADAGILENIVADAVKTANALDIEIIGGHTEITNAVNKPVLSGTVIGKSNGFVTTSGALPGDDIVMTKWAGVEGTAIIAADHKETLAKALPMQILEKACGFSEHISVVKEALLAVDCGATSMHDVTEGGILGALYELSVSSQKGVLVNLEKIPVREETAMICAHYNINPYRLISSGVLLFTAPDGQKAVKKFAGHAWEATVIGKITEEGRFIIENGKQIPLTEPEADEIYKI